MHTILQVLHIFRYISMLALRGDRLGLQVRTVILVSSMVGRVSLLGEHQSQVHNASQASFEIFHLRVHEHLFQISYISFAIILVSASPSCFAIYVSLREVSCAVNAHRAFHPHSLQIIYVDCLLYFGLFGLCLVVE